MSAPAGKRVSRACLHCRQRKSRCDLDSQGSPGTPPCQRCLRENRECVLGGSNRGGRRIRKNRAATINDISGGSVSSTSTNSKVQASADAAMAPPSVHALLSPIQSLTSPSDISRDSAAAPDNPPRPPPERYHRASDAAYSVADSHAATHEMNMDDDDDAASSVESNMDAVPQNPSDAWQYLAHMAGGTDNGSAGNVVNPHTKGGIRSYRLVRDSLLSADTIFMLVARFREHYHGYLPLVPRVYYEAESLDSFAVEAPHLLTAICTIASKDLVEVPHVHGHCSKYMHELISGIAAGSDCNVEAVEALLLLAEWEPQGLRNHIEAVGRGEEDRAAWMHVGLALRSGYFLGLDRTAFRSEADDSHETGRKRLAWASCYVSDRLISVRIGKAFWSRGPGPMAGLSNRDFPSLSSTGPGDEDYASIFQATLDLTQLYGNVHEVLYSGMRTSGQMMLMGDYVKYVDDFRSAISRWNRIWGTLTCAPHIKVTLQMSYEYLRLYTNAFAFQAAISQALASKPKGDAHSQREHLRAAFADIASMPDARFIYESMDAAKSYLTILNNFVDPERHLRYMPLRFYLYSIYSAVFLYKARSFGVMNAQEEPGVRQMIKGTMERLRRASVSPQDLGSRYSRLLELLWQRPKPPPSATSQETPKPSDPAAAGFSSRASEPSYLQFSPANDFSWLDLEAVGDYVSNDQYNPANVLAMNPLNGNTFPPPMEDRTAWQPGSNWMVDLNGNLLF